MTRLRILVKMERADAFELKAQALNKDPRITSAGISSLRFLGDKNYIPDREFSPALPPPTAPAMDSDKPKSDSTSGQRLRVVLRMSSKDAFELKAQALNNDPRLKDAGIAALKFVGDKQYISGGEFSHDLPPAITPETAVLSPKPASIAGKKLRIVLRAPRVDVYELVARH